MKRLLSLLIIIAATASMAFAAGKAEISFKSTNYDFGNIKASGGSVTAVYEFTNTGSAPLAIINVTNGGCGCTKPSYPVEPILPGKSGVIKITFNPAGRRGELAREVKVKSNASKSKVSLTFSGMIIP